MINYMAQRCHELLNAYHTFFVTSSPLTRVAQKFYNFVPAFQKLSKGGTEIVQACHSCRMVGFCASTALAFVLGVELFDYVGMGRGVI